MKKIFIIEDDPEIRGLYQIIFNGLGFNIVGMAEDGQKAVDMFKTMLEKPDLIIMDYRMPRKNGIEASIEILQIDREAKILFATADNEVCKQAKTIGVAGFIRKPFRLEELMNDIKRVLN